MTRDDTQTLAASIMGQLTLLRGADPADTLVLLGIIIAEAEAMQNAICQASVHGDEPGHHDAPDTIPAPPLVETDHG